MFTASIGAEALKTLLEEVNLEQLNQDLQNQSVNLEGQAQKKALKRMKLIKSLINAGIRPEWMLISTLPVIPPDLRPMVQLDGGRFAASDLNDLYRRVINRNNRLKKLLEIKGPEVITRNEKGCSRKQWTRHRQFGAPRQGSYGFDRTKTQTAFPGGYA